MPVFTLLRSLLPARRSLPVFVSFLVILTCWNDPGIGAVKGSRIFALGDIHGDYKRLVALLNEVHLLGPEGAWNGGDSTLIITGDFTDRGPEVKKVMDLLMSLQEEAEEAGGEVRTLFGNHEMMNIIGDFRYVSDAAYASFADEKSEVRREEAWNQYVEISQKNARRSKLEKPVFDQQAKEAWFETHPLGFFEYRDAMGPRGRYGRWLREMPVVEKRDRIIFLHGGIHPSIADLDLDEINKKISREREKFDEWVEYLAEEDVIAPFFTMREILSAARQMYDALLPPELRKDNRISFWFRRLSPREQRLAQTLQSVLSIGNWLSIRAEGPVWFRGFSSWNEDEGIPRIEELARRYDVDYFVVGHTITSEGEIVHRLDGRVILINTLKPTALEIRQDSLFAISPGARRLLLDRNDAQ